jgi:predicted anti-sigma-YlaC factor YlaD
MTQMKGCGDFCGCLSDYLDGTMDETCCRIIEEHLESCDTCSTMYETLKTTVLACAKGLPAEIPENVRESLRTYLRTHCKKECV